MFRDTRKETPPQIAARARVLALVAVLCFGALFFRLWSLQVLHGSHYRAEANAQRVRLSVVRAPRGDITDRSGHVLVTTHVAEAITINPRALPPTAAAQAAEYRRLGRVLGHSPGALRRRVADGLRKDPVSHPTLIDGATFAQIAYITERQWLFPGVGVDQAFLRSYPYGTIGSQLFGTVGELTSREQKDRRFRGARLGDRVGQSGIEYGYDRALRGRDGADRVEVNASGQPVGTLGTRAPRPGDRLRLSIDLSVEQMGQQVMAGRSGAFVVMDVHDGELLGLGSSPSFDPGVFARPIDKGTLDALTSPAQGAPLTNRATQGLYPTGSTFKLITATAALQGGLITPDTIIDDGGSIQVGGITFQNSGGVVNGPIALRQALQVSSDVFFYTMGVEANSTGNGLLIQDWAHRLGLGQRSGIDLPGELSGLIPSPAWRNNLFKRGLTDRPWSTGDDVNLAVGQGDVEVTPLQLARAYAAVANGGWLVTPRVGLEVDNPAGHLVRRLTNTPRRWVGIDAGNRQAILDGLRAAASQPGGTSADVFRGFPIPVAGKTGTAQKGLGRPDQSWYVALAPYPNPRYVVAVTDETGGFGAQTAAPDARRILAALFGLTGNAAKAAAGSSTTF